ncbi:MAG TPA: hypothetical protein VFD38_10725 [Myxococcaceae bacterium]|nr:hypothetical protein [Myxococcaceae bacterium]
MKLVDEVQDQLQAIYDIECPRASEFLLHPEQARLLRSPGADEELWVREDEDGLEIGLYFSPALRTRLEARSLRDTAWLAPGLDAYCRLAEGVSHFLYLAWSAALGRRLTILELEVQAEVDKFASLVLRQWPSLEGGSARELHVRLFRDVSYRPGLSPEEEARYVEANRLAALFTARLLAHVMARRLDRLLEALRYAYRLGAEAKLQHLARAG